MNDTTYHIEHEKFTEESYRNGTLLPNKYVFILTNQCNLSCSFCFQKKMHSNNNVTTKEWLHLLSQLPEYARVTLTGGEPLLHPDFKQIFNNVVKSHTCNIITNGLLLDEDIFQLFLSNKNFKVLSISIDDPTNNIRGVSPQRWNKVEQQIVKFVELKNKLRPDIIFDIKTNILDETAHLISKTHNYCKEVLKCDSHAFQFLKGSKLQHSDILYPYSSVDEDQIAYRYKNFEIIKKELEIVANTNPIQSFLHPKILNLNKDANLAKLDILNTLEFNTENFLPCKFPWSSVHINHDGNLFPCLSISMGNIKDQSLKDIIFGEKYIQFKTDLKSKNLFKSCNRCGWLRPKK